MIRFDKYFAFCEDFYSRKLFPHRRFGQAFINTFWLQLNIVADPEIFYEENATTAARKIEARYVDFE